jgi:hypothetical protein
MANRLAAAFLLALLVTVAAAADPVYLPLVQTAPAALPDRLVLHAPGYGLVGGATAFVACTTDGTLLASAYAVRPDGTEGHTVFRVQGDQLVEIVGARGIASRGSLLGTSPGLAACGGGEQAWSVGISGGRLLVQRVQW